MTNEKVRKIESRCLQIPIKIKDSLFYTIEPFPKIIFVQKYITHECAS